MSKNKSKIADKKVLRERHHNNALMYWMFLVPALLILPVIYTNAAIDQVLMIRFLFLSIIVFVVYLVLFIGKSKIIQELVLIKNGAIISWMFYIAFSVLSVTKAINPVESLFDISKSILFLAFTLLLTGLIIYYKNLKPIITIITILSIIYLSVGYIQYFKHAFGKNDLKALYEVIGIMSHKNFYSSMLYLMIPVLLFRIFTVKNSRLLLLIILFFILTLIFLLQTRSVWLSFAFFIFIFILILLIFRKKIFNIENNSIFISGLKSVAVIIFISVVAAWGLTSISIHSPNKSSVKENKLTQKSIENIEQRAASMFTTREANTQHRLAMWKMSFEMIKMNPIMGIGAGNWKIVVFEHLTNNYNLNYFNNIRRPHNDLIWILSEKGFLGLISYLIFFIFILIYSIKVIMSSKKQNEKLLVTIAISGIAGYFADSCLSFPYERIEHQVMLMLYVSLILSVYFNIFSKNVELTGKFVRIQRYLRVSLLLMLLIIINFSRMWLKEEVFVKKSISANLKNNWNKTISYISEATTAIDLLDPRNTPALWYRGKAYLQLNQLNNAFEDLEKAYQQNPNSILVLIDLGTIYEKKGDLNKSNELFKKSLKIYPTYKDGLRNLGIAYYLKQNYIEALNCFVKLRKLSPGPEVDQIIDEIKKEKLKIK